jgi:para-aminobenzoate synthetase component 1
VGRREGAAVLGSAGGGEQGRYSYFMYGPVDEFIFEGGGGDVFGGLGEALGKYPAAELCEGIDEGVFVGGWVGFFGYDLNGYIERVRPVRGAGLGLPVVWLKFYDRCVCVDHLRGEVLLIVLELPGWRRDIEAVFDELGAVVDEARGLVGGSAGQVGVYGVGGQVSVDELEGLAGNMTRDEYFESVGRIKRYILDGDVYQVNFSQRFCEDFSGGGVELFCSQLGYAGGPFSAYLSGDGFDVVSASPELFVDVRGERVVTRPIKGTRRRVAGAGDDDARNAAAIDELLRCEKEQAELNMIIDLERNDLTRICRAGSIKVSRPRRIERYATVYHCMADVEGLLREGFVDGWRGRLDGESFCRFLKGVFPGGSISGAPKISAMNIINELEPTAREVYTGSIGFISQCGSVCLNIAIRTVIIVEGKAYVQVGGAVVADSEAANEWRETLVKAAGCVQAIRAARASGDARAVK